MKYILGLIALSISVNAQNLLENPSFEEGDKMPDKWLRYQITPEQAVYGSQAAHSGKRGIGLTETSGKYGGGWIYEKMLPVRSGDKYRLSCWIKSNSYGGNNISIAWFGVKNGRPNWFSTSRSKFVKGVKNWTLVKLEVTVPPKAVFAKINLGRKWSAKGSVYFDDVSLVQISGKKVASAKLPEIDWQKAVFATRQSAGQVANVKNLPVEFWLKYQEDAGTFAKTSTSLEVSNTSLDATGWISKEIPVKTGEIYSFETKNKIEKAYHVAIAAVFVDAQGKTLGITRSKSPISKISFQIPPKCTNIRLLLTQSRSSGKSTFSDFKLTKLSK